MKDNRVVFLDWLRVIACFLVILTHSNEPVYLGGQGTAVASAGDAFWSTFFVSLSRCCVPLFVLASSYLLFPVKGATMPFLKRRLVRVGIPALLWLVLYSAFSGSPASDFTRLPFNFPMAAGHLWFCYMILGLYLLMPLLSPWAEKVGKKELLAWLGLWGFTTLIPLFRQLSISLTGTWSVWGEANWSEFGTFYYVSGFIGYLLLGLYFRKFAGEISWRRTLSIAIPLFVGGFAIAAAWFYGRMPKEFPFDEPLSTAVNMETMERNCTVSVLMMTLGAFLCIRKISADGAFYRRIVLPVSKASYGVYLMHIFALVPLFSMWSGIFSGVQPFWATPLTVVCTAVTTFLSCSLVSVLVQRIPVVGKYIVG